MESDGSEEEDVVILTADKSGGFQQRYDSGAKTIPQMLFSSFKVARIGSHYYFSNDFKNTIFVILSGAYQFSLLFGTSSLMDQNYRSFVVYTIMIQILRK